MEDMGIYTYEMWGEDGTFKAKPGQFVDDETFYQLRDCVPPLHCGRDYMQVGEAYSHDEITGKPTYTTFIKESGKWKFVGHVPDGEARPTLKRFEDLEFVPHEISRAENTPTNFHARMYFENGYGVSVVIGGMFYSNGIDTYEVAVMKDGKICYDTSITDDVLGHLEKHEVTEVMRRVQML